VISQCAGPGVSIASIALAHGLNANLLRRWVVGARSTSGEPARAMTIAAASAPEFIPLALAAPPAPVQDCAQIRIEINKGATQVTVTWPVSAAEGCSAWLRELVK